MNNIEEMSDEQLKAELITDDFHGREFKEKCLEELIDRVEVRAMARQQRYSDMC